MTHDELVQRAGTWLRQKGCGMVFMELVTTQAEIPDAIGWRNSGQESFLIECKATRGDFLVDKRKSFRSVGTPALGRYRYYFCPPGLISPDELPPRWGLLYCHADHIKLVRGRDPKRWGDWADWHHEVNFTGELRMFYSALSRLKKDLGERQFHERVHLPYTQRKRELQGELTL